MKYASLNASLLARKGEARPSTTVLRPVARETFGRRENPARTESIQRPTTERSQTTATQPKAEAQTKSRADKRVAKTVRLSQLQDTQLRLLAARHKRSVQDILEEAITRHLKREMNKQDCICKAG